MRSVIFHLRGATREEVAERLSTFANPNGQWGWILRADSSVPILYLDFYNDLLAESQPASLEKLRVSLGAMPDVSVIADISGRVPGDIEVRELAALILTVFRGVAQDDYTDHCWTLPEIQAGAKMEEYGFFDYNGWHHDSCTHLPD